MNLLKQLNAAAAYIEKNLCGEPDWDEAARLACTSRDGFLRFFSYMTGMTVNEYIRRRRLSCAVSDLQNGMRVIDAAVKYGYDSADAFRRAFARQHGVSPSKARNSGAQVRIYPPVSFRISVKGATEMKFRWVHAEKREIYGISKPYDGQEYASREAIRHSMWNESADDVPGQLCTGRWNEPGNHAYDGIWYGLWRGGRYMIARERENVRAEAPEKQTVPAGRYAAFASEEGEPAWEALPRLFGEIFDGWLPDYGYEWTGDAILEVYQLFTDREERRKKRRYEVWIPVKHASNE